MYICIFVASDLSIVEEYIGKSEIRRFIYIYALTFNKCFDIRGCKSRVQAKIAPPFSAIVLMYSTLCTAILFTVTSAIFQKGVYKLCTDRDVIRFVFVLFIHFLYVCTIDIVFRKNCLNSDRNRQ